MTSLHSSLADISQHFTVFVKDQVLTEQQLNSVSAYFQDQIRLTRNTLSGVGIIDGLVVTQQGSSLLLSSGVGITADGDLLVNYQAKKFNQFKRYSPQSLEYPAFLEEGKPIPMVQLLAAEQSDDDSQSVADLFTDQRQWVFVLLAETLIEEKDLCTGTHCDNGSHTYRNQTRLLAAPAEYTDALIGQLAERSPPAEQLERRFVSSIRIEESVTTQSHYFDLIRNTCAATQQALLKDFEQFWGVTKVYLQDYLNPDPTGAWVTKLTKIGSKAQNETFRLQYYYELLADLCQAWNALIDSLQSWSPGYLIASPAGAKHLLLGELQGRGKRTGFFPAPIHRPEGGQEVLFYIHKIGELLTHFGWTHIQALQVTPSKRALASMPGFYHAAMFAHWDYAASVQGRSQYLLGYQAAHNDPRGGADKALLRQQAEMDSYRIEGALGKAYLPTLTTLNALIRDHHLPFSIVGAVLEGGVPDVLGPVFTPRRGLRDFQYLLKRDLSDQLAEVQKFSTDLTENVLSETKVGIIREGELGDIEAIATSRNAEIQNFATSSISLLNKPAFDAGDLNIFNSGMSNLLATSGQFKNDVAAVTNTHFPTQFDQLINSRTPILIDWIDRFAKEEQDKESEKHLLNHFISQHPGLEISNGVGRGGTLVLIYNAAGTIVATAMLAQYIEPAIEAPVEPELPKFEPPFKGITIPGLKLKPSLNVEFDTKLNDFKTLIDKEVTAKVEFQSIYPEIMQNSLGLVRDLYVADPKTKSLNTDLGDRLTDLIAENLIVMESQVLTYDEKINTSPNEEERSKWQDKKAKTQQMIADSLIDMAEQANDSANVRGSKVQEVADRIVTHSNVLEGNQAAIKSLKQGVDNMSTSILNKDLQTRLGNRFD